MLSSEVHCCDFVVEDTNVLIGCFFCVEVITDQLALMAESEGSEELINMIVHY